MSTTTCIAVGGGPALVERTTNAGGSWSSDLSGVTGPSLHSVSCPDVSNCVAVGDSGSVLTSSDGGGTWHQSTVSDFPSGASLTSVACPDTLHCWASASPAQGVDNLLEATSDGGATWSQEHWPIPFYDAGVETETPNNFSITCPSTTSCLGVGGVTYQGDFYVGTVEVPVLFWTYDGGETWASDALSSQSGALTALSCPTVTTCIASGFLAEYGNTQVPQTFSLSSAGAGGGWVISAFHSSLSPQNGIDCLDTTDCVAVGVPDDSSEGFAVMSTSDGGSSWHAQPTTDPKAELQAVSCINAHSCWAVGSESNGSVILHTVTGGQAWPGVTSVFPQQGPVAGGIGVRISGVHFDLGVTSVSFGTANITVFTVVSPTQLIVTAPAVPGGVPTTVDVQVHSRLGTSPATPDDQFTYTSK